MNKTTSMEQRLKPFQTVMAHQLAIFWNIELDLAVDILETASRQGYLDPKPVWYHINCVEDSDIPFAVGECPSTCSLCEDDVDRNELSVDIIYVCIQDVNLLPISK